MVSITYRQLKKLRSELLSGCGVRSVIWEKGDFVGLLFNRPFLTSADLSIITMYLAGIFWFVEVIPDRCLFLNFRRVYLKG